MLLDNSPAHTIPNSALAPKSRGPVPKVQGPCPVSSVVNATNGQFSHDLKCCGLDYI